MAVILCIVVLWILASVVRTEMVGLAAIVPFALGAIGDSKGYDGQTATKIERDVRSWLGAETSPSTIDVARETDPLVASPPMISEIKRRIKEEREKEHREAKALAEIEGSVRAAEMLTGKDLCVECGLPILRAGSTGCGDDLPDHCDPCWGKAHRGIDNEQPVNLAQRHVPMHERMAPEALPSILAAPLPDGEQPTLGRIAYDAYGKARNWIAFNNQPIPQWEERPNLHEAWETVAKAVLFAQMQRSIFFAGKQSAVNAGVNAFACELVAESFVESLPRNSEGAPVVVRINARGKTLVDIEARLAPVVSATNGDAR